VPVAERPARPWFDGPWWSWRPITWEGWLALAVWMFGFVCGVLLLEGRAPWNHVFVAAAVAVLFLLRRLKGS
jgi:hypothetical protein